MNYTSICAALKERRERAGYTQAELARFFGMDASLIQRWETGITEPTISECLVLSKLYGISLDEMFGAFDARAIIPRAWAEVFEAQAHLHRADQQG